MVSIEQIPTHKIAANMRPITELLEKVVPNDTGFSMDSVLQNIVFGESVVWSIDAFKALVVTEVVDRPAERVLWVKWAAGSDMGKWIGDWVTVQEEYAKATGCASIEFNGRLGFLRKFGKQFPGYKAAQIVYKKRII